MVAPADADIVPFRSLWKYWDQQFAPPEGWRELDFNDERWSLGNAPLGYSFAEDGTHISTGPRVAVRQPAYFRHEFWIEKEPDIDIMLRLAVHRHGGTIVYINGVERFHDNAGPTPAPVNGVWALSKTEDHPLQRTLWPFYLQAGKNVIAVESRPYFRSLCSDLALAAGDRAIARQPLLTDTPQSLIGTGQVVPNLEWLEVGSRETRSIEQFRGKHLVVDIMGMYCGLCWQQLPKLQHWARQLKNRGVVVAVVSANGTVADIESVVQRYPGVFPDLLLGAEPLAGDFFATMACKQFGVPGTPSLLLIDPSGTIRASGVGIGGEEYDQFLTQAAAAGIEFPAFEGEELEYRVDEQDEVHLKWNAE
jgi:hypothetical protein